MAFPSRPTSPRRAEALATMRARHPTVAARFSEVYGFVLSEQVTLLAALFASLDDAERRAARALELSPAGVTSWFGEGALDRVPRDGLDPRLDHRFWCDPPEAVTVMLGGADGHHVMMFHDEPAKPPWLSTQSWARETGEATTWSGRMTTLLEQIHRVARDGAPARTGSRLPPSTPARGGRAARSRISCAGA